MVLFYFFSVLVQNILKIQLDCTRLRRKQSILSNSLFITYTLKNLCLVSLLAQVEARRAERE